MGEYGADLPTCRDCVYYFPRNPVCKPEESPYGFCRFSPPEVKGLAVYPREACSGSWCAQWVRRCPDCSLPRQLGYERGMGGRVVQCPHRQ